MEIIKTDIVVIGGGPGGYTAAFLAADQGKQVVLVEKGKRLGGTCLNRGCIPSKAYLNAVKVIKESKISEVRGIEFSKPTINPEKLRGWKESVLEKLAGGISGLARRKKVEVISGAAKFNNSNEINIETADGLQTVQFERAILASGSKPALPKAFNIGSQLVMTSEEGLEIPDIPENLLVIGGGYIGMELGTVYSGLGSQVTVIEALDTILAGADPDLIRPVKKFAETNFKALHLSSKVVSMEELDNKVKVVFESEGAQKEEVFDRVLVSIGRVPSTGDLNLESTKIKLDERGFVRVDKYYETDDPSIYAIGDVAGGALLAHKAAKDAHIAVHAIDGQKTKSIQDYVMPFVVFTDPEVAWCGITETEAKERGAEIKSARYPWSACGRALTMDRPDGVTKLIFDPATEKILGVGIVGAGAGELIPQGVVAVEKGLTASELADLIYPHPTLSETFMESAESFLSRKV